MVIHFLSGEGQGACGRSDANLNASNQPAEVTCKTCRRTNAFTQAEQGAAPQATAAQARVTPPRSEPAARKSPQQAATLGSAWQSWQVRLSQTPGKQRLPRSRRRAQMFV